MTFIIQAYDATDADAYNRRLATRDAHFAYMDENIRKGTMIYGAALLDDTDKMIGSMVVVEFATKQEVQDWLAAEPYVTANVWDKITIYPCKTGKSFEKYVVQFKA